MHESYTQNYERGISGAAMQVGQQSYPQAYAAKAVDAAGRAPELPAALERLTQRMADLREAIHLLDKRLTGSVARSASPAPEQTGQIKGGMQTGFGGQLDALGDMAAASNHQLRDLLDRLEF